MGAEDAKFDMPDTTRYDYQAMLFKKLSWINIAVTLLSYAAASSVFSVKKMVGDKEEDIVNHDFEKLLRRPNPEQSKFDFMQHTFAYLALTGNAYWHILRPEETDEPLEIWTMPPKHIKPILSDSVGISHYEYNIGYKDPIELPKWQILHLKRFNPSSMYIGHSQAEPVSVVSESDLAMQRYNKNFFSKQNAKIPGAIGFKDNIPSPYWEELQQDIEEKWGGMERRGPMILRNVGEGVTWIPMALTQSEMDFINSRNMNRDEVFSTYAPGLLSMISPDSTEANARIGKATFTEFTLWPMLQMLAEKITSQILPLYGTDLTFSYKDTRVTDTLMKIREQREYAQVHTINEIRQEVYNDKPLPPDKGDLLVGEITSSSRDFQFREREGGGDTDVGRDGRTAQELKAWRAYEKNKLGKKNKREFVCEHTPDIVQKFIFDEMPSCLDKEEIDKIFDRAEGVLKFA